MALYVHDLLGERGRMKLSRLTADTIEELEGAARALELDLKAYFGPPRTALAYYRLEPAHHRRARAELGAQLQLPAEFARRARALGLTEALKTPRTGR